MLSLKPSVKFGNHQLAMAIATQVITTVLAKFGYDTIVTSANDGTHMVGSLHYSDSALDFRSKHINSQQEKEIILAAFKEALTKDFDIVLENENLDNEHYHCEFDPK